MPDPDLEIREGGGEGAATEPGQPGSREEALKAKCLTLQINLPALRVPG